MDLSVRNIVLLSVIAIFTITVIIPEMGRWLKHKNRKP